MTIDEQIAALREAIASGAKRVRSTTNGVTKEVEYRSFADMMNALSVLEAQRDARRPRVGLGVVMRS